MTADQTQTAQAVPAQHPMLALAVDIEYVHACWQRWQTPGVIVDAQYDTDRARVDAIIDHWRLPENEFGFRSPMPTTMSSELAQTLRLLTPYYPAPATHLNVTRDALVTATRAADNAAFEYDNGAFDCAPLDTAWAEAFLLALSIPIVEPNADSQP